MFGFGVTVFASRLFLPIESKSNERRVFDRLSATNVSFLAIADVALVTLITDVIFLAVAEFPLMFVSPFNGSDN